MTFLALGLTASMALRTILRSSISRLGLVKIDGEFFLLGFCTNSDGVVYLMHNK